MTVDPKMTGQTGDKKWTVLSLSIWRYLNIVFVKIIGSIPRDRHGVIIINTRSQITDLSKI